MRLTDEPGQDVETFGNKIAEMARQISGTGYAPIELYTLFATAFIDCEVLAFHMKSTGLHNLSNRKPKSLSVDDIIWTLKTKFWSHKAQGLSSTYEGNILDM